MPEATKPRTGSIWPALAAVSLILLAGGLYTLVNLARLAHFVPLDYDLAIFTQGLHLLAHGEAPFVTVRGMNLFGEHATWIHLFLLPLYRLLEALGGARALVLIQSTVLGISGWLVFRFARGELGSGAALLVLSAYLLYPPLQYCWLEYYQPVALAIPALFVAFLSVRGGRAGPALAASTAALLCMENLAATVGALGLYALVLGRRRLGLALAGGAAVYALVLATLIFPALHPGGYAYGGRLYGDFASDVPGAAAYLARPDHLLGRIATEPNTRYVLGLLVPVGFVPLAAPVPLFVAAQLPLNLVASWPYAHEIRYHYVAPIIPFVFVAVVLGVGTFAPRSRGRRVALGILIAGSLAGQVLFGPYWLRSLDGWRPLVRGQAERRAVHALLRQIPPDASVAASYRFLPHLAERGQLYMFPKHGTDWPDVLLIDLPLQNEREAEVLTRALDEGGYRDVQRTPGGTTLLVRPRAAGSGPGGPPVAAPRAPSGRRLP